MIACSLLVGPYVVKAYALTTNNTLNLMVVNDDKALMLFSGSQTLIAMHHDIFHGSLVLAILLWCVQNTKPHFFSYLMANIQYSIVLACKIIILTNFEIFPNIDTSAIIIIVSLAQRWVLIQQSYN